MLHRVLAAGFAAALPFSLLSQMQPAETTPPIRVQVNEVIVPVTVTDDKGRFVTDLEKKDFQIIDEGKPQQISYFTSDRKQPVVVGFLIDTSNGMKIHWSRYQEAASELAQDLLTGDAKYSGYLISYGNQPQVEVDTTSDPDPMVQKLTNMKPGGGAALFDAVYAACVNRKVMKGEPYEPRRVIVIIGDGHDTASKHSLAEVLEVAQKNLVTIYGMSTIAYGMSSEGDDELRKLAEETGGRVEYPLNQAFKDISGYLSKPQDAGNYAITVGSGQYESEVAGSIYHAVADIAGEITTQYILRYVPDEATNAKQKAFHDIKVQVALPNVKVRYRKGYYPQMSAAPQS